MTRQMMTRKTRTECLFSPAAAALPRQPESTLTAAILTAPVTSPCPLALLNKYCSRVVVVLRGAADFV